MILSSHKRQPARQIFVDGCIDSQAGEVLAANQGLVVQFHEAAGVHVVCQIGGRVAREPPAEA
eukprot:scaffold628093_cov41-Prasinocladus_malaysianus.AAC.1